MSTWFLSLLLFFLYLVSFPLQTKQQDNSNSSNSNEDVYKPCSFLSQEGCMNGICKFCALCIPTYCVLATPYTAGDNQGSICAATDQAYGIDFYNYCLLSVDDDDSCSVNTICYPYRQNNSSMRHSWTNLTCDQNACQLIMNDGNPPPIPIPLEIHHSNNSDSPYNKYNIRSKSPTSIALIVICIIIAICLLILLIRIVLYKPKLTRILTYFSCISKTRRSRPPSYQVVHQPMIEILPSYDEREPSPPKYEQAIVTQIRDYHPSFLHTASTSSAAPIWIPVYVNHDQPTNRTTFSSPLFPNFLASNDWATIRHHQPASLRSSTIEEVSDNEDLEERRR